MTNVPARYSLEVEVGRDRDIVEWLATDTSLDRPVLLRILAGATPERRAAFLTAVRGAAAIPHNHIVHIFEAGEYDRTAYSVSEWTGGMTLADRTVAHEPVDSSEFLPNASGLAAALAALHDAGVLHGAIDESAIFFSAAHPAKLGAFGRPPVATSPADDTRMLAETLERSLTGDAAGTVAPSHVVDGFDEVVDTALTAAQTGEQSAGRLASSLRSAPSPRRLRPIGSGWSWRWLLPAAGLALVALALVVVGASLVGEDSGERNVPVPTAAAPPPATSPATTATTIGGTVGQDVVAAPAVPISAEAFDPFGGDGEHDELSANVIDGDFGTVWRTESYFDPLPRLKPGVGIAVRVDGSVAGVQVAGVRDGSAWTLYWAEDIVADLDAWTPIANGTVRSGRFDTDVPVRRDGAWLIWFTELPASNEGTFNTTVAEVRFRP